MEKIYHGCPICKKDVRGTEKFKYYCHNCRLLFNKQDLYISKRHLKNLVKKHIVRKIDRTKLRELYK